MEGCLPKYLFTFDPKRFGGFLKISVDLIGRSRPAACICQDGYTALICSCPHLDLPRVGGILTVVPLKNFFERALSLRFFFLLGKVFFDPSRPFYYWFLLRIYYLHTIKMPISNGDAATNGTPLRRNIEKLDYRDALKVLESDYPSKDGLDIHTLLDSRENGALTYNDFLVLPGYIGT